MSVGIIEPAIKIWAFQKFDQLKTFLFQSVARKIAAPQDRHAESPLRPWIVSLLFTIAFFVLYLFVFHPGYQVDDDITMISLASGYLGGKSVPFLIFSNVILGFLLDLLYRLPTQLNWEILLFIALDFFSVWCLVHLVLSFPLKAAGKVAGMLVVFLADGIFLLSITFTMIAVFAAIAGFCSMLAAAHLDFHIERRFYFFGGILIFAGSLIRIESVLLVLLSTGLSIVLMRRLFDLKRLIIAFAAVGLLASGSYLFDKLYVRSHPEWQSFYTYNDTRSFIQDTPRLHQEKFNGIIQQIGWHPIDRRMFESWFISDEQTYSLDKLQYIVDHVPGVQGDLFGAVLSYFLRTFPMSLAPVSYPYLLMLVAAFLSLLIYPSLRPALVPLASSMVSVAILFIYLLWTQKVPPRVWYSFLAVLTVFAFFIIACSKTGLIAPESRNPRRDISAWLGSLAVSGLMLAALFFTISQAVLVSAANIKKQNDYQEILSNLDSLQAQGKIQPDALIVIPAMGIPLEWANPMVLDFPKIQVLELGWLAFSPPYRDVLRQHDSYPLLTSLYEKDNVYLMTRVSLIAGTLQFFKVHTGANLQADPVFLVNYPGLDNGAYANTVLYKLKQVK